MRRIIMAAAAAGAALALSATRGEARGTNDEQPYDGHISDSTCSISDGMEHSGGTTFIDPCTTIGGGSNGLDEGCTDFGDGGSGIISDGGTQVIGGGAV